MRGLPIRRDKFDTPGFAAWLATNGAEVGIPTNQYEAIRYKAHVKGKNRAMTHIVYAKENGLLTFTGASQMHYLSFLDDLPMQCGRVQRSRQPSGAFKRAIKARAKLLERDGSDCWYCGKALGDDMTLEHLIPKSKGGANNLVNCALAHQRCNLAAADLPLADKMALRIKLRSGKVSA